MKLIDQLKREQAQKKRVLTPPGTGAPIAAASQEVMCAIEALYCGLADLADGLNQLEADAYVDYEVESVGTLRGLRQRSYTVLDEDATAPRFAFGFECMGTRTLTRRVPSVTERQQIQAELQSLGLTFSVDTRPTLGFAIVVRPFVAVRLEFEPTPDGREVRMTAWNLNRLGRELYSIHPDEVSVELVDELGKLVLRRPSRFADLTGNRVSPAARERLRASLKREGRLHSIGAGSDEPQGASAAARVPEPRKVGERRAPHVAPLLVSNEIDVVGPLAWADDALAQAEPSKRKPPAQAIDPNGAGASRGPAHGAFRLARYAWVITDDAENDEPSESMAKRGPPGTSRAFPTPEIVSDGDHFRLVDADGDVRFRGMVLGHYRGTEPLEEFGRQHGCCHIELERSGQWVRLENEA